MRASSKSWARSRAIDEAASSSVGGAFAASVTFSGEASDAAEIKVRHVWSRFCALS